MKLALLAGSFRAASLFGMRVLQINLPANFTVRMFAEHHLRSISVISGGSTIGITVGVLAALRENDRDDHNRANRAKGRAHK